MPDRGESRGDREAELKELLEEVRRIDVLSTRLVTDLLAGGYTSVFRGTGIEFDGVREYVDGDDPRSVDWNVTARVGRPFVKKYVDERELTVLFLLDLSASMTGGFAAWSVRQTATRVCACLALAAVRNDDKVGLVAFGEGVDRFVPPKKGAAHVLRIVRDCLALPSGGGRTDVGAALDFAVRVARRRSIVFLASDFLTALPAEGLARCARRHDLVAVRIRPPELELPAAMLRVRDPESRRETVIDGRSRRVREAYADRVRTWLARTESDLRRAGVDLLDVPVPVAPDPEAVARPIVRFFRMRARRGARC